MSKNILIIGAGGHAKSVIDALISCGEYEKIAVLEDFGAKKVLGFEVVGKISDSGKFLNEYENAVVAVGNNEFRLNTINKLKQIGFNLPVFQQSAREVCCLQIQL